MSGPRQVMLGVALGVGLVSLVDLLLIWALT